MTQVTTTEIVEELKKAAQLVTFLSAEEGKKLIEELNAKSPNKLKLTGPHDNGSFDITEEKTGISITISPREIQG